MKLAIWAAAAAALIVPTGSAPASPSVYTDDLSRCLVDKTSKADQVSLVKWIFAAVSAGPDVRALSSITPEQRKSYTLGAGQLMARLLTVDCRAEAVKALKYDGASSLETAFGLLGEVAMKGLMSDPAVMAELEGLERGADLTALTALFVEAGMRSPTAAPK